MDRRRFVGTVAGGLVAIPLSALAQQPRKIPVVGFLTLAGADSFAHFQEALRDLGYVADQNVVFERRSSSRKPEPLPGLAAELVRLNVDVLYATGPAAVRAARDATRVIPIVAFDLETDPVGSGLVRSLARPDGNLTGLFLDLPGLAGKWLELLTAAAPGRTAVGVLWDSTSGSGQLAAAQSATQRLNLDLQILRLHGADELDQALRGAVERRVQAMVILSSPLVNGNSRRIAEFTVRNRLPAISPFRAFADGGGTLSYGPNLLTFLRFSVSPFLRFSVSPFLRDVCRQDSQGGRSR